MPEIWAETLYNILNIENEYVISELLILISPSLPENLLPQVLESACSLSNLEKKSELFCIIAPRLPEIWSEALEAIQETSKIVYWNMLIDKISFFSPFPFSLWCEVIYSLKVLVREDILEIFEDNIQIIKEVGGSESLKEIADAVNDVGRWFP